MGWVIDSSALSEKSNLRFTESKTICRGQILSRGRREAIFFTFPTLFSNTLCNDCQIILFMIKGKKSKEK